MTLANFFDQFDSGTEIAPSGRPRVWVSPDQPSPFANAISSVESGGNYRAIGPDTGGGNRALGKYQVMASNVGPWSKEVFGQEVTPQQFLENPQIQDAIFNAKFGAYEKKYGPEGAARAWFAGEGGMNDPNRKDILGTTVADYGRRFVNALGPSQANAAEAQPQRNYFDSFDAPQGPPPVSGSNFFDQFDAQPMQAPQAQPDQMKEMSDLTTNALRPQVSTGRALAEGVLSGASGNFRDEIYGASAASGLPEALGGFRAPIGAAKLAYESYNGVPGAATEAYNEAVNRIRNIQKEGEQQHPYATLAGNLGGALAIPVGRAMTAATLPGRIGQGALVGAGLGAVYGAGGGENLDERARGVVGGALLGGAVGAAAPVVVEGVTRGARAVGTGIANTVRGVFNPADEAARRVAGAMQRDMRIDPAAANRLTPSEFAAGVQSGGPVTLMDIGGETTRALARSAANTSPEGRQALNSAIDNRFESQANRVVGWLRKAFNYPDAKTQQEALTQVQRTVNRANYAAAYRAGDKPLWSPELERLTGSPSVQSAIKSAVQTGKDRAVTDGFGGFRAPITVTPDGRMMFNKGPNGAPTYPNLQFWDYVRRELSDAANAAIRSGRNEEASRVGQLASTLNNELDSLVPSYAKARAGASWFFGAQDALEAGQNFVTQNFKNADARAALAKMAPVERSLFQDGFVSRFIDQLNQVGDRRNILNAISNSPNAKEKMMIALGPQKYAELEAGLRVEGIMDLARSAIQGNSTTARQLAELGLAGGAYGLGTGGDILNPNPSAIMNAALVYGLVRGRTRINENVSRKVAEMLTSNDPTILLRGIKVLTKSQNLFNSLRAFDGALAKIGSYKAGPTAAPLLPAIGRAQDDQQTIPGPPAQ